MAAPAPRAAEPAAEGQPLPGPPRGAARPPGRAGPGRAERGPRSSDLFLQLLLGLLLLGFAAAGHAAGRRAEAREALAVQAAAVRRLGLTDLCLFTEARYTRHPSMADRFAPFQDHPRALEHFPSGSVAAPPP
jgi:hypothetical protein